MKIIHIAQTHEDKLIKEKKPSQKMINKVAQSQLQVAIAIQKYPGIPIVSESLAEEIRDGQYYYEGSVQDLNSILLYLSCREQMKKKIANIFPHGIPTALEQLTVEQKDALYEHGAAMILWCLNKVTILHPCVHSSELKKDMRELFDHPVDVDNPEKLSILEQIKLEEIDKKVDDLDARRELEAIECVEVAAYEKYRNLNEGRVLLVYGAAHNFKPYCDARGYKHQYINCAVKFKKPYSWRNFLLSYGMLSVLMLLVLIIIGFVLTSELGVLTAVATAMVSNLTLPGMILLFVAALGIAFIAGEFIGPYFEGSSKAKVLPASVSREERINQLALNQAEKDRHLKSFKDTLEKPRTKKSEELQPWILPKPSMILPVAGKLETIKDHVKSNDLVSIQTLVSESVNIKEHLEELFCLAAKLGYLDLVKYFITLLSDDLTLKNSALYYGFLTAVEVDEKVSIDYFFELIEKGEFVLTTDEIAYVKGPNSDEESTKQLQRHLIDRLNLIQEKKTHLTSDEPLEDIFGMRP